MVASHCKPCRDATNNERLDGEHGLLLTYSIDHLFDRDFIGFEDSGTLIVSPVAHLPSFQNNKDRDRGRGKRWMVPPEAAPLLGLPSGFGVAAGGAVGD